MFVLAAALSLHLIPLPQSVQTRPCSIGLTESLRVERDFDPAALDEINERWKALGIPALRRVEEGTGGVGFRIRMRPGSVSDPYVSDVSVEQAAMPPQAYGLRVAHNGAIEIQSADAVGAFYAAMTLAQLPQRVNGKWFLPCVDISDAPALKWRVLSDDVSRGSASEHAVLQGTHPHDRRL